MIRLAILLACAAPAPPPPDARVRTVAYDDAQVVSVRGRLGYHTMIEFAPDERIENVSVGSVEAWQVTPNKKANLLFLKPLAVAEPTNMTVVTSRRRYLFDLEPPGKSPADAAYVIRFRYLESDGHTGPPPERWNLAYSFKGAKRLRPLKAFDDGRATYFRWPDGAPLPAVFLVGPDGRETMLNVAMRDDYLVVDQLSARFVLRRGGETAVVVNDAYREPVAEPR